MQSVLLRCSLAPLLAHCVMCPPWPSPSHLGPLASALPSSLALCCLPSSLAQSAPSFWPRPRLGINPALGCQLSTGSGDSARLQSYCSRSSTAQKHRLKVKCLNIHPVAVRTHLPGAPGRSVCVSDKQKNQDKYSNGQRSSLG